MRTDHVLFVAAGAFHVARPSDLIPELQGRFPIRVELDALTEADFVRILTEPEHSLPKQAQAAPRRPRRSSSSSPRTASPRSPRAAAETNRNLENIGARRLHTILERVLAEISFAGPDAAGRADRHRPRRRRRAPSASSSRAATSRASSSEPLRARRAAPLLLVAALAAGCGRKVAPEAPLLVIPARPEPLRVTQEGGDVVLRFPFPAKTVQGAPLTNLTKVTVFREIRPGPAPARRPRSPRRRPASASGEEKLFRQRAEAIREPAARGARRGDASGARSSSATPGAALPREEARAGLPPLRRRRRPGTGSASRRCRRSSRSSPRVPPVRAARPRRDGGGGARLPRVASARRDARRDDPRRRRRLRRLPAGRGGGVRTTSRSASSRGPPFVDEHAGARVKARLHGPRRADGRPAPRPRPGGRRGPRRHAGRLPAERPRRPPRPRRRRAGTGSSGIRCSPATSRGTASTRGTATGELAAARRRPDGPGVLRRRGAARSPVRRDGRRRGREREPEGGDDDDRDDRRAARGPSGRWRSGKRLPRLRGGRDRRPARGGDDPPPLPPRDRRRGRRRPLRLRRRRRATARREVRSTTSTPTAGRPASARTGPAAPPASPSCATWPDEDLVVVDRLGADRGDRPGGRERHAPPPRADRARQRRSDASTRRDGRSSRRAASLTVGVPHLVVFCADAASRWRRSTSRRSARRSAATRSCPRGRTSTSSRSGAARACR